MTIGTAIVVIAAMYFIDRHKPWKHAAIVLGSLAILSGLGVGGYFAYQHTTEKKAAAITKPDIFDRVAAENSVAVDDSTI
jgi:hypothetical protein